MSKKYVHMKKNSTIGGEQKFKMFNQGKSMGSNEKNKKLSVIIPTLNRAELLRQTLYSIAAQTMKAEEFEVIVIDNGSVDHTGEVCKDYQNKNGNLKYIFDARPGLHIGRNRGYVESKTDILVYADDDIIASQTWLETIYKGFEDKETVLIGGNNYPCFEARPPKWINCLWTNDCKRKVKRLETFSVIIIGNEAKSVDPGMIFGCNFAIRKEILNETIGFHPDGMPDKFLKYRGDGESYITQYIRSKRMKAMFYPGASVQHMITKQRMSQEYVKKVAYRTGISFGFSNLRGQKSFFEYLVCLKIALISFCNSRKNLNRKKMKDIREFYLWKGYLYIVIQFGLNGQVRKWIKRNDYLDADISEYGA